MNLINDFNNLTLQAKIVIALGLIQFLSIFYITRSAGFSLIFMMFFMTLIYTGLNAYSVNCLIKGDCNTLAWIVVAFAVLSTFSILAFSSTFSFLNNTKNKIEKKRM